MINKKSKGKKPLSKSFYTKLYLLLGLALVILASYTLFQTFSVDNTLEQITADAKEAARPAELELIIIQDSACNDCFDISPAIDYVKGGNVKIVKEENLDIKDATEIINKYGVETVPTLILRGEIDKIRLEGLERKDDALVLAQAVPPYTDVNSGQIKGRVSSTIIKDLSCKECTDLVLILNQVKGFGVSVVEEKVVEKDSNEAKDLIDRYKIEKLPALILSKDLGDYSSELTANWEQIGSIESDGSYVLRIINPPYLDIDKNKVRGLVSIIFLEDKDCETCFGAEEFHKPILEQIGLVFIEEKSLDVSSIEGKSLIDKYSIEKVPTIVLTGDVDAYSVLTRSWESVGTVEPDGAYVFRKAEVAQQPYMDLTTGKIVEPTTQT